MSKNNNTCPMKKTSIGGQALMEGIMMRGPKVSAMAVRNTDGEIVVEKFPTETKQRKKFFRLPFVRGLFNYIDSMRLGTKCLMRSAELSGLEEAEEEMKREKEAKKAEKLAKKQAKKGIDETVKEDETKTEASLNNDIPANDNAKADGDINASVNADVDAKPEKTKDDSSVLMGVVMTISMILGVALAVGLFIILPSYIYKWMSGALPVLAPKNDILHSLVKSVFEGLLRIIILVAYMALMTLMKDIRRTFMYHGAEHKTIFCYEKGLELTVENVRKQRRFHPRCGTSFLIIMVLVSILVSFFIDPLFLLTLGYVPATIYRSLLKLLLIPIIVGIGYELLKLAGRHENLFTKIISAPGMWLQRITVLEPDDSMIECAIAAVKEVIPEDESDNW